MNSTEISELTCPDSKPKLRMLQEIAFQLAVGNEQRTRMAESLQRSLDAKSTPVADHQWNAETLKQTPTETLRVLHFAVLRELQQRPEFTGSDMTHVNYARCTKCGTNIYRSVGEVLPSLCVSCLEPVSQAESEARGIESVESTGMQAMKQQIAEFESETPDFGGDYPEYGKPVSIGKAVADAMEQESPNARKWDANPIDVAKAVEPNPVLIATGDELDKLVEPLKRMNFGVLNPETDQELRERFLTWKYKRPEPEPIGWSGFELAEPELCQDEGCPQQPTKHVCVERPTRLNLPELVKAINQAYPKNNWVIEANEMEMRLSIVTPNVVSNSVDDWFRDCKLIPKGWRVNISVNSPIEPLEFNWLETLDTKLHQVWGSNGFYNIAANRATRTLTIGVTRHFHPSNLGKIKDFVDNLKPMGWLVEVKPVGTAPVECRMNDFPTVHIVKAGSCILTVFATRDGADVYVAKVIAGWKVLYGSTFEFDPASIEILEEKVYP